MSKEFKGHASPRLGNLFGAAAAAALMAGIAPAAAAQPAADAGPDSAGEGGAVGEVIVTARHRRENAQSAPVALSVVGGDFLAKANITKFSQLVAYVPSVQFTASNPRNSSINIRGLGNASGVSADSIEPGVGYYVDQVYYNRPATTTFDLMDIDQIEVLRGPQGTLYGKNTTAGAISITTASPSFTPQASGEITGGSYGYFTAKASVSGPLIGEVLAGRLSASTSQISGLATNDFSGDKVNGYRNRTVRGQLLYQPRDDLKLRLITDYSHQHADCCYVALANIVTPPSGRSFVGYAQAFGYTPVVTASGRRVNANSPQYYDQETGGVSLLAERSLPGAILTSVTAWRYWDWAPQNDLDNTPLSILTKGNVASHASQLTQEFRIASSGERRLDYVGGLYFYRELITADSVSQYGDAASYFLLGPAVPSVALNGYQSNSAAKNTTTSYAAFGQATYHITPQLSLIGGLRYTHDSKRGRYNQVVGGGAPLVGPLAALAPTRAALASPLALQATVKGGKPSGQVGLSYQATPDVLAYVTVARGTRSGGINLSALPPGAPFTVKPETIDSFEAGLKTAWLDRRVTLNLAAYLQNDRDYIGNIVVTGTTRTYLANIPKVRSRGIEADLRADPNRYLSIHAAAAYSDARYQAYPNAPCPLETPVSVTTCALTGRPLAGVPRWTAALGGEVRYPLTLGAREVEAYVGVDDTFRSTVSSSANGSVYGRLPSLNRLDARAGVRAGDGQWDVYVWGKNITDEEYFTALNSGIGNLGSIYGALGDPATWGVTLRARY